MQHPTRLGPVPTFAAYVLRTGPYAGKRLREVAAADPAWLLSAFATSDTEAVDTVAIRGFVNASPPLILGDTWIVSTSPVVTIAPLNDLHCGVVSQGDQMWNVRVAGEDVSRFPSLAAARVYSERLWGVHAWTRLDKTQILVGQATTRTSGADTPGDTP